MTYATGECLPDVQSALPAPPFYTTDRWSDYFETNTNTTEALFAVSVAPTNKLWAAGANGTIITPPITCLAG
jgi:hypothetical protein